MSLRGLSKDRNRKVTPPGPVAFSNEQFDLRNNRMARPTGARPLPPSSRRESTRDIPVNTPTEPATRPSIDGTSRSASSLSHRRAQSALSNYSSVTSRASRQLVRSPTRDASPSRPLLKPSEVVPSATYIERGHRWMEKEEAVSLRDAMDDMDVVKQQEAERIQAAAQAEASELVWQHQNPGQIPNPHAPYGYKDHLRKNSYQHARTQSVGRYGELATGLARDIPRSVSAGSSSSGGPLSPSTEPSELESSINPDGLARGSLDSARPYAPSRKSYGSISSSSRPQAGSRRSSSKRNVSGEPSGTFTGQQIWEEPEHEIEHEHQERGRSTMVQEIPSILRIKPRNPLNRVQFAHEDSIRSASTPPEPTKKLSKFEIYRNPPSQSRNPLYTANPPVIKVQDALVDDTNTKEGLEIRSEEIRQATSMRMKDRSPKLPTPTAVSDKPGRPIVSFDTNWKPKEADVKPEERRQVRNPFQRQLKQGVPPRSHSEDVPSSNPTIQLHDAPAIEINSRPVPTISFPDSAPTVPTIHFPDSTPPVPTINISDAPIISISVPSVSDSKSSNAPSTKSARPLPDPKSVASRPSPRHHATAPIPRGHWSPAGRRATATCHQCQLAIEGRVVGLRGAPEKYHPQCFICFTCGTGLEALEVFEEPPLKRSERLDRIERRKQGEELPETGGQTTAEDGDERLRYFCHLDWHELYAPKCKHCKTSILGEHMIALGEHWHFGHFFCAECGDPFEKGMSHIEKDGYAWCINCQTKRTERRAPKCKKCKLPVIGEAVQAMGGEWHDKCFRCSTCKGDFPDGSFFPKVVGGETVVVCTLCMEIELKS